MREMVANGNGNGSLPQDSKDKFMHCASNCENRDFGGVTLCGVGEGKIAKGTENVEINITECSNSGMDRLAVVECEDDTENSSSFGGTVSGVENDSAVSDVEVESALCSGSPLGSVFDGLFLLRKRKLTDHWRRFVRPLMWRCKWLELQLREFKSRALKYDKELAEYDQRKNFEDEKFTFEGLNVKSQPFPSQIQRKKLMKRRKRKRVEDTADLASYMSNHNLFSYYDSKKSVAATASATHEDDNGNLGNKMVNSNEEVDDGLSSLELKDGDIWLQQILRKIDLMQSQVHKLKTRVDNVVNESPRKFTSVNVLSSVTPCNTLTGSRSHSSPPGSGERTPVTSQRRSGGFGFNCFMIHTEDDILIHNHAAKEELRNFQGGLTQQSEEPPMPAEPPKTISTVPVPGNDLPTEPSVQPNANLSLASKSKVPNNKRKRGKRGKRKSGTSWWSRRSSGQPVHARLIPMGTYSCSLDTKLYSKFDILFSNTALGSLSQAGRDTGRSQI
ncbi:1-phosphatidylinositol-4,5-bisphosphate phosphodiesterase eta-1 [Gossypium arboreum]|uniref:1-phosphatidylinositol-4,5-bisphosphate phosphodiesterase eta-1 n=1 Tax=Gossypium arboreum TaxID=29729 RepID=A0A0B0NUY1_GOSAR|nr:1-phosphatidylinositol-4,5-bisphosphate phosphodiesterase eta-1 [Gossypium arboreum]KHG16670.1 1-phosphatidylinositol-4,5-bisphosphate phosphodiesterase eta-1 [Gossypium arboreum]